MKREISSPPALRLLPSKSSFSAPRDALLLSLIVVANLPPAVSAIEALTRSLRLCVTCLAMMDPAAVVVLAVLVGREA